MKQELLINLDVPVTLFTINNEVIMRDRSNYNIYKKEFRHEIDSNIPTVNNNLGDFLLTLEKKSDESLPVFTFLKQEEVKEDYVLSLSDTIDKLDEKGLFTYFYYLGKLLGQLTFFYSFDRVCEIDHIEDQVIKVKSNLTTMLNHFNDMADKIDGYFEESFKNQDNEKYHKILRVNGKFIDIIDVLDAYSKEKSRYIQKSTLLALNYISLYYTYIFGTLLKLKQDTIPSDFIKRCIGSSLADASDKLDLTQEEFIKFFSLSTLFFAYSSYYQQDEIFRDTVKYSAIFEGFFNIGKQIMNNLEEYGIDKVINTLQFSEISVFSFFNDKRYYDTTDLLNDLSISDADTPIYICKTLDSMIDYDIDLKANNVSYFNTKSYFIPAGDLDFLKIKQHVEEIISKVKIIKPNIIYKLLTIAGYCRTFYYQNLKNKFKYINVEYISDVIVMCEIAVYNFYQEWFNRASKIYRFEARNYYFNDNEFTETIQETLKNEILLSVMDYCKTCYTNNSQNAARFFNLIPNLIDYTVSLHPDYKAAFNNLSSKEMLNVMENQFNIEFNGVNYPEYAVSEEMGKIGILTLILLGRDKDLLLDTIESNIALNDFFAILETNSDAENPMKSLIEGLTSNDETVGSMSNSEIYKRINTNIRNILSSTLSYTNIFYLAYGLNYIYIKHHIAQEIKTGNYSDDVILSGTKTKIINEDADTLASVEHNINLVFKDYSKPKKNNKKYGF